MAIIQDGIEAIITYLKAQADITALVSTRVYGLEIPATETETWNTEAKKAILCRMAGGISRDDYSDMFKMRIDFMCYGETPYDAMTVWRTLKPILRDMEKNVTGETVLYSMEHSAGPFSARDRDMDWANVTDTWLLSMEESAA